MRQIPLPRLRHSAVLIACLLGLPALAQPAKLDAHLQALLQAQSARSAEREGELLRHAVRDAQGRIGVSIALADAAQAGAVAAHVQALGGQVKARWLRAGHTGALAARLPLAALADLAERSGVRAIRFEPRPVTNIGAATSQGVAGLRADQVHALGITGKGITVAAISDSYAASKTAKPTAAQDVASGDLPGPGNPNGKTNPVVTIGDSDAEGIDEGRAMLQIVHDVAPDAKLCFGSAAGGAEEFVQVLGQLTDPNGPCKADVVVDDFSFWQGSMFSDNLITNAIADAAAQGVQYFSSAGNRDSNMGYIGRFSPVANDVARAAPNSPVNLALIPAGATLGGFHNFAPAGAPADIAYQLKSMSSQQMNFQWNDLFDSNQISTDYDIYIFSGDGNKLLYSGNTDNTVSDRPMEYAEFGAVAGFTPVAFQVVIARKSNTPGQPEADLLRWVQFGFNTEVEYPNYATPLTYGNNAAAKGNSVAASPWWAPGAAEVWSSPGPMPITFDAQGRRLAKPRWLQKPDFSAMDDGNNTLLGFDSDEDADKQPNFSGTSASAPHAAAVAALMLEKAGGPRALAPAALTRLLQQSAAPHDLNPFASRAVAKAGDIQVVVDAIGNGEAPADHDSGAFTVRLKAPAGTTLQSLTLQLASANANRMRLGKPAPGLWFNPGGGLFNHDGAPAKLGEAVGIARSAVSFSPLPKPPAKLAQSLTVRFADGAFTPQSRITFGVGREEVGGKGATADMLAGGTVQAVVRSASGQTQTLTAAFSNRRGKGWTKHEGFGLINAERAVDAAGREVEAADGAAQQ